MDDIISSLIKARNEMNKTTEEMKKVLQELNKLKEEVKTKLEDIKKYETDINKIKEAQRRMNNQFNQDQTRMENSLQSLRDSLNNLDVTQTNQGKLISQNKKNIDSLEKKCSSFITKRQIRKAFDLGWAEVPQSYYKQIGISVIGTGEGRFKGKNWGETYLDKCWEVARDSIPT